MKEGGVLTPDGREQQIAQPELSTLLQLTREAAVVIKLDGTITCWNNAAVQLYGYTVDEIVGHNVSQIIPSDDNGQWRLITEQIRRGETLDLDVARQHQDGRRVNVSLRLAPIRSESGAIVGILSLGTDLEQRNRVDRAERSEFFLSTIISSAEDAIISKNLQGIVTSWNPAAETIFGYTAEEMIGKPIAILIPPDHPDEEAQILEKIRRGEHIDHYEAKRQRKDGRIIDVSLTISPIRDNVGRIIGASKIARDICQRRRWQKAEVDQSFLGALVESAEDAIIGKDLEGIVTSWNPAAEKLYGYKSEEMIGKPIALLIPPNHPDAEPQILERIRRGECMEHYETQRIRKDGRIIDVSLTVSPIRDSLGRVIGASKIARDISDRKRADVRERQILMEAQEARRQADLACEQAEEASKAKDEFLATVSHELRTPMTAIMGWSRMLVAGQLSPQRQHEALRTIDRNAQALAQLIEDLLDISRIMSGQLRVEFRSVDLQSLIGSAMEAVRPSAEARGIRLESVFVPFIGPVIGDAERLQQVLWNLLSNAIKFTSRNGRVRVELERVDSHIEIRVVDNGMGINAEYLPHVFHRFSQADSSITRRNGGLGMGLAIVKSLVELHGGVVSASSEGEGRGAVFTIKLPINALRAESLPRRVLETTPAADLKPDHALFGLKLLIVDDEPDTCDLLRFVFNECGAIVKSACSAMQALEVFDGWQPDIVVSDIGMPEVDGFELIRTIRQDRRSNTPAVALTAMARIEDRIKVLTAGYQMHVSKPVQPTELIAIVSSLIPLIERRPTSSTNGPD